MSAHVVFNEPTDEYFPELELLKVDVASECRNYPADYQFLVGMQHIDDEDGLVYVGYLKPAACSYQLDLGGADRSVHNEIVKAA